MFRNLDLVNIKHSLFTLPVDHFGSHVAFPDVLRLALFSVVLPLLQFLFEIPLVQFPFVLPLVYFLFVLPPVLFPVEYHIDNVCFCFKNYVTISRLVCVCPLRHMIFFVDCGLN